MHGAAMMVAVALVLSHSICPLAEVVSLLAIFEWSGRKRRR